MSFCHGVGSVVRNFSRISSSDAKVSSLASYVWILFNPRLVRMPPKFPSKANAFGLT